MRINKWFSSAGLIALALIVLFSTLFTDWAFRGMRFDLTQGHMYTLSDGTKHIVRNLKQPVDLYFYFSKEATRDAQGWRGYAKQVKELLEEYVLKSNGKLRLHVIDPEPFSEQEDQATAYGLEPVNTGNEGDKMYFGLVAKVTEPVPADTSAKDAKDKGKEKEKAIPKVRVETIPIFEPGRQQFLEYDISKLIYRVNQASKPKIALLSNLDVMGGFDFMTRSATQPWAVISQLEQLFTVRKLNGTEQEISPKEYQLLLVIHPKTLTDATRFAIDQYVLKGGHALIFVDPFAELDHSMGKPDRSSDLPKLFKAWGVDYDKTKIVGDAQLALQVGMGPGEPPVRDLAIMRLTDKNMPRNNLIVGKLETLHVSSAGYLTHAKGATTTFEPLLYTSKYAMPIDAKKLDGMEDPSILEEGFKPTGKIYTIGVHITGNVKTAFPDGPPKKPAEAKDKKDAAKDAKSAKDAKDAKKQDVKADAKQADAKADAKPAPEYLKESVKPINVVIVADTDVLSDRLWVHVQNFFGQRVVQPFADNGDFLYNAVDTLSGSSDLISIRGRGRYFRPFTVVRNMQREAQSRFQQVEDNLKQRLQTIETKLTDLHAKQGNGNEIKLTPDMQKDLIKFEAEKVKIRKQLRDVQHQLNKDIDKLDFELKVINIAGVPFLMTLLVIGIAIVRRRRAHSSH